MAAHLAGQRRLFEDTQRLLVEHAAWLQPGDWVPEAASQNPSKMVWHHTTATLPAAVVGCGGKAGKWAGNESDPSGRAVLKRMWREIRLWAFAMAARVRRLPQRAAVPSVEPSRGNASVVMKAGGKRVDFVALEPEEGRALRLGQPGSYDHEYVEVRSQVQRFLSAPGFSVSDNGAVLIEDWVDGQVLTGLSAERRVAVAVEVLDCYAELVAQERALDEGTVWQALPRLLDHVRLPEVLRELLADPRVGCLLTSGLLIPGHGEQTPDNVLVDEQCSSWHAVDFDGAGWLPVWWDPVSLVGRLLQRAGGLTETQRRPLFSAADRVWAAAGLADAAGLTPQHWMALMFVRRSWREMALTSHPSVGALFVEPDPDDFAWHLHQQARTVEAQLARR